MSSDTAPLETWTGDAVGLVEAFRAGERSPLEELEASFAAVDASDLNAVCFEDRDAARAAAAAADVSLPFGGVPVGVKELTPVEGWPDTEASVPLRDGIASHTATMVQRLVDRRRRGARRADHRQRVRWRQPHPHQAPRRHPQPVAARQDAGRVVGRLGVGRRRRAVYPIATGGDGGGSIRIPAGFTGLVGLKGTFGRIPRGPHAEYGNLTVSTGCMARSVRDTARWFDVTNGHDPRDPLSLPRVDGWEAGLGTHLDELRGARVAVVDDWGGAVVSPIMWELLEEAATALIDDCGLRRVIGLDTHVPRMGGAWSISGMISIAAQLADKWPDCADDLTPEMRFGLEATAGKYDATARARIERRRTEVNEAMARIFDPADGVDFVITATNPDVAFDAEGPLRVGVRRHRGGRGQQRSPHVPGQPARQPGDLGAGRLPRRTADRPADRRPPLLRAAAARPRAHDGTQPPLAAHVSDSDGLEAIGCHP